MSSEDRARAGDPTSPSGTACRGMADGPMSRRAWLGSAALTFGAGAFFLTPLRAKAQQKTKQADVKYQTMPKGNSKCAVCMQFQAPNACKLVEGEINPEGWCLLYTPKAHS